MLVEGGGGPGAVRRDKELLTGQGGGGRRHCRPGNIVFCFEEFGFLIDGGIDFKQPFVFLSKDWCVCRMGEQRGEQAPKVI